VFSREQAEQMRADADAKNEAVRADQAAIESATAAITADSASLGKAKVDLSYCLIRSPIDGRTGNLAIKQGNLVKANDVDLVTILQIQPVYVTFSVPEVQLAEIRSRMKGGRLNVRATPQNVGGAPADGALTFIDNSVDNATGTIKLKATFANAGAEFWPGQFLNVSLKLSERPNSVVIPAAAIQNGQIGNYVFIVKQDGTADLRPVTLGPKAGSEVTIEKGVQAGERVVTEGHVRLVPGTRVRILS
jgi:multidrug efflux system membrane fusion protein